MRAELLPLLVVQLGNVAPARLGAALGEVHLGDHERVVRLSGRVRAQHHAVDGVVGILGAGVSAGDGAREGEGTHVSRSGSHWHVKEGQVSACVMTVS
jgi:hypothetical protein